MKKKVLLTGSTGFIGSHLKEHLRKLGVSCVCFSGDISSFENVYKHFVEQDFELVYHFGGMGNVIECEANPDKALLVNVSGTLNILESIRRLNKKTNLVFASTGQVYSISKEDVVLSEDCPVDPSNIYALSKVLAEDLIKRYFEKYSIGNALILRLFNHTHKSQKGKFFFPQVYSQLLEAKELNFVCRLKTGNINVFRDFSLIDELTFLLAKCLELPFVKQVDTINICSGQPRLLLDLVHELVSALGVKLELEVDKSRFRGSEPELIVGSNKKMMEIFGWGYKNMTNQEFVGGFLSDDLE